MVSYVKKQNGPIEMGDKTFKGAITFESSVNFDGPRFDSQYSAQAGANAGEKIIDCDLGNLFTCVISQNTNLALRNIVNGQPVVVAIYSPAGTFTITTKYDIDSIPTEVTWTNQASNGGDVDVGTTVIYTFLKIDGVVYGSSSKIIGSGGGSGSTTGAIPIDDGGTSSSIPDETDIDGGFSDSIPDELTVDGGTSLIEGEGSVIPAGRVKIDSLYNSCIAVSAFDIDWELGNYFYKNNLVSNSSFTFSNSMDGQTIQLSLTTTVSSINVDFSGVIWTGGLSVDDLVTLSSGQTIIFTFSKMNGIVYGTIKSVGGATQVGTLFCKPIELVATEIVDCSTSMYFTDTISWDPTYEITNLTNGQAFTIALTSGGPDCTVAFTSSVNTIKWSSGAITAVVSAGKTNVYTFLKLGDVIYANSSNGHI